MHIIYMLPSGVSLARHQSASLGTSVRLGFAGKSRTCQKNCKDRQDGPAPHGPPWRVVVNASTQAAARRLRAEGRNESHSDPPVDRVGFAPARYFGIVCAHPSSTCHRHRARGHGARVMPGVAYILKRQPPQAGHLGTHAPFPALGSGYGPGHAAHRGQSSIVEMIAKKETDLSEPHATFRTCVLGLFQTQCSNSCAPSTDLRHGQKSQIHPGDRFPGLGRIRNRHNYT